MGQVTWKVARHLQITDIFSESFMLIHFQKNRFVYTQYNIKLCKNNSKG